MELCGLLEKFFIVTSNLNKKLVAGDYLTKLSDNNEKNYSVFGNFVGESSSTLVCVMHKLGHCGVDERLKNIIARHLEIRECFGHEEDDAESHIADFKRRTGLRDKQ